MSQKNSRSTLYPPIDPYNVGSLDVSDLHTIVYEEVGDPDGRPTLFLHGGPGVGIMPDYRRFFDPQHFRTILVDQRGSGRSTPHAETRENTTWDIVADLEKLREHLGVERWILMGGSWGSLLSLCYAIKHPDRIAGMIIRGIFLGRQFEIDWVHGPDGAARIYPEEFEKYRELVAGKENLVAAYCDLLASDDEAVATAAARAWSRWEGAMVTIFPDVKGLEAMLQDKSAISIAMIESYYTHRNFFLEDDNWVLNNASAIENIPLEIIHGRYDTICPPISAWDLHKALPKSNLVMVPDGAHSPLDGGMTAEMVKAADKMRDAGL